MWNAWQCDSVNWFDTCGQYAFSNKFSDYGVRKNRKANIYQHAFSNSCGSAGKESAHNVRDLGSITELGRSPGEGNSYWL